MFSLDHGSSFAVFPPPLLAAPPKQVLVPVLALGGNLNGHGIALLGVLVQELLRCLLSRPIRVQAQDDLLQVGIFPQVVVQRPPVQPAQGNGVAPHLPVQGAEAHQVDGSLENCYMIHIPEAGHLISIYALGVCAGAFSLILMHKYRPKKILIFLASIITIGAIIASVAPTYWLLLCARFIQGLPHGAYFGTATIVAVKMAKEGKGTKAVAMMCAGMPVANLVGVPIGTFLSHAFSWRVPFVSCILLGIMTMYMIHRWVPDVAALPNKGMKAQFHFLRSKAPWLIIAATFLGNGGILCWFSYISPLLQMEGGFSAASISLLMILAGGGMVVGNQVSALLADRFKPGRFTCYLQFLAAAALLLTFFLAPIGWVSVVLMFICCACLFGIGSPEQFLIVKHAKGGEMLGGCCIQGAFNLGNAMGAFLGGIPVAIGLGYNFPALIGVPMALAGAICLLIFHKKYE